MTAMNRPASERDHRIDSLPVLARPRRRSAMTPWTSVGGASSLPPTRRTSSSRRARYRRRDRHCRLPVLAEAQARGSRDPPEETEIVEPAAERHVRTPSDVLHLIVGVLLVLIGVAIAAGASNTLVGLERDTIAAFDFLPEAVARALYYLFQGFSSLSPRRSGCSCCGSAASGCSACSSSSALVSRPPSSVLNDLVVQAVRHARVAGRGAPAGVAARGGVHRRDRLVVRRRDGVDRRAGVAVGRRPWRRLGWVMVVLAIVFRVPQRRPALSTWCWRWARASWAARWCCWCSARPTSGRAGPRWSPR